MATAARMRVAAGMAGGAVLLLATAAGIAGLFGDAHPGLDFVNNFAPGWLGAGLLGGIVALAAFGGRRRSLAAAGLLLLLLVGYDAIGREVLARVHGTSAGDRPPTLTLLQFNAFKDNDDPARAAAWIARQRPDIVTLEEGLERGRGVVLRLRPLYPYQVSCLSGMRCSTVILSRVPFRDSGGLARGDPENRKTISAVWATFADAAGPFTVVAVHMKRPWPAAPQARDRNQLSDFLLTSDPRRTIVAGDFNLTPWTRTMRRQDRMFGLARLTRALPSWPAYRVAGIDTPPLLPIDQVYAGTDWRLAGISRGPRIGSDHYPLLVALSDDAVPSPMAAMKR